MKLNLIKCGICRPSLASKFTRITGSQFSTNVSPAAQEDISESETNSNFTPSQNPSPSIDSTEKSVKPFSEIPDCGGLPYFGTLFQYTKGPYNKTTYHHALLERHKKYGKIFKETIAGQTRVHLFDPDYIRIMYSHEGKVPFIPPLLETTQMYRKYREMSPGLGNTNGEQWYRLRSAVQQMMMRPKAVSQFLPQVNEVTDDFVRHLDRLRDPVNHVVPNFNTEVLKWTLESAGMTCFETRFGGFEGGADSFTQKMIGANKEVFSCSLNLRFSIPWHKVFSTPTWKRLVTNEDFFFGNAQRLVDETCAKIDTLVKQGQLSEGQYGFLTYLLGKKELSYKDVSIITMSLFADGLSTTSPTVVGQLFCLANNPDKQQRLYEEIMDVTPSNEPVTADIINAMSYLKCCIKEGFRFFPIGTEVSRIPQEDIVIGGYQIPAGTHVELNNNMLLHMEEYFDSPESYVPERWFRGGSAQDIHPYLLLPFGFGPRTCAGKRFAELDMHVFFIKLLRKFKLEWRGEGVMRQQYQMLLTPDQTASIAFIPRT